MIHKYLPSISFLASKRVLNYYIYEKKLDFKTLKDELFLSQRDRLHTLPNEIHQNNMNFLFNDSKDMKDVFLKSVKSYEDFFEIVDNNIYIRKEYFSIWQRIIIKINPLILLANFLYIKEKSDLLESAFQYSSLPSTNNTILNSKKFDELHIHINGTSEMIYNWLHILNNPKIIYKMTRESFEKNNLQYTQLDIHNKGDLYRILIRTSYVRKFLINYFKTKDSDNKPTQNLDLNFFNQWKQYLNIKTICPSPFNDGTIDFKEKSEPYQEALLWYKIFEKIDKSVDEPEVHYLTYLIHFYVLSMSLFNKFLIQQSNQYGFSQFQFITDNELRDHFEDTGFTKRYLQLKGMYNQDDLNHLELRFAPKTNIFKLASLYKDIISDHHQLKQKNKIKYTVSTIAHFIKTKDDYSCNQNRLLTCRWVKQREKLDKEAHALIAVMNSCKRNIFTSNKLLPFFESFSGIDAAGNELYTRPEVFSPSFLFLNDVFKRRFNKTLNITFHAGEDFVHLISGIRYVYEAATFLQMNQKGFWNSQRIGHATALGICPKIWAEKLNFSLIMPKGEYLDNLIFIKFILNNDIFDEKIKLLWKEIYNCDYNYEKAIEAYNLRKKNPYECDNIIIQKYNSANVVKKYNALIDIEISNDDIVIMLELQRKVMTLLKDNNIAIESMITSNVRISYYENYKDHHIVRWLMPSEEEKNIIPIIVIASDDPGIFNNNMRIEFCHLDQILHQNNCIDINTIVKTLQDNSKNLVN